MSLKLMNAIPKLYFSPQFVGFDSVDYSRPALWVGNHSRYGLLDIPLMLDHVQNNHDVLLHGLADKVHFKVPIWRDFLSSGGAVLGTPEECSKLMQNEKHVLVFPGGAREVMRRRNEQYTLVWKKRLGFVRMALQHGYDIIPFASLGPDESFDVLIDANDVINTPWWKQLNKIPSVNRATRNGDVIPPISKGIGLSIIPKPQRFYFSAGERISLPKQKTFKDTDLWDIRNKVAANIMSQLGELKTIRKDDRDQNWSQVRRFLT